MGTNVHLNSTSNILNPIVHEKRMATFPHTHDITQVYFLSVMLYLIFLQHCRLDKQGSNLH